MRRLCPRSRYRPDHRRRPGPADQRRDLSAIAGRTADLDSGPDFDSKVVVKVNAGELVRREHTFDARARQLSDHVDRLREERLG